LYDATRIILVLESYDPVAAIKQANNQNLMVLPTSRF